jgi:hypothetical protein
LEILPASKEGDREWTSLSELYSALIQLPQTTEKGIRKMPSLDMQGMRKRHGSIAVSSFRGRPNLQKMASMNRNSNYAKSENSSGYIESMLNLYQALCFGPNANIINMIVERWKIIDLKQCIAGLKDESLPCSIRGLFCDLIRVLFVDKFPVAPSMSDFIFPLKNIIKKPNISDVLQSSSIQSGLLGSKENEEMLSDVSIWISEFLKTETQQVFENKYRNQLILSSLKLIKILVIYGNFNDERNIISIFKLLVDILDGRTDVK